MIKAWTGEIGAPEGVYLRLFQDGERVTLNAVNAAGQKLERGCLLFIDHDGVHVVGNFSEEIAEKLGLPFEDAPEYRGKGYIKIAR